ncbi:glycosyltransferase family A protein [Dokdonia sp. Hel_I_53]|uniref:glycosyltransferase family A protein n=1 Tax=Dokdonia sp. Hel_I_53 TaxID=1566287 RepID=UPI001198F38A|nr:glycosyltransferase family A protein [Dokdonia sp. Hel_I_53]TVZ53394.1 glycosyl transferase family 2 [Dokdonia sp. Hel_I_53]
MRVGVSAAKQDSKLELNTYHRVIIPVYIPNLKEEYFEDGLEILKFCIDSLLKTIHSKTRVTIINNGCCDIVVAYLYDKYQKEDTIDQLFHSDINLGKVNAIYGALKSNLEPLITITDADVMFLPQWQNAVEHIFEQFPKAGMVSPVPSSIAFENEMGSSTIGYAILKGALSIEKTINRKGLERFQESIGRTLYEEPHLEEIPVLRMGEKAAAIGCGHFVVTMKRSSFDNAPVRPSAHKIVGGSERRYIDKPNNDGGFLRLATLDNYAYHLGNKVEEWMVAEKPKSKQTIKTRPLEKLHFEEKGLSKRFRIFGLIVLKLFKKNPSLKMWYFKKKGLTYDKY